ncbi:MAG: type II secretion system protein GspN [Syntrophus sp. GWC2_56_31]|nr:MAG: type II secretion system protein GspN [Syntrophus sp. GWC2_56_31]
MRLKLKPNWAIAGYILAGIAMFVVCLYLRFPGEALANYAKAFAAQYPGSFLSIDEIRPSFPPGLALANVKIGYRDYPGAAFRVDDLSLRPGGLSLLKGRLTILLAAKGYGGEARGQVDFSRLFSFRGPLTVGATLRGVRIEKIAWLQEELARQVTGTLEGAVSFSGKTETPNNMTGNVDFTLTNGVFPLTEGFLDFKKIDFSKIEGKLSFQSGTMRITQLTLTGAKVSASLKGNILIADEFRDSRIDLTGTVEIPAYGNKRLTLNISGTIDNPKTRLM